MRPSRSARSRAPQLLLALLLGALPWGAAAGEMYRWTDAQGNVHLGATPPPGAKAELWEPGRDVIQKVVPDRPEPPAAAGPPSLLRPRVAPKLRPGSLPRAPERGPGPEMIGGWTEREWRREAQRLGGEVERLEQRIEDAEDGPEFTTTRFDPDRGFKTGQTSKASLIRDLEKKRAAARKKFDDLEDRAREAGVPPGWLR